MSIEPPHPAGIVNSMIVTLVSGGKVSPQSENPINERVIFGLVFIVIFKSCNGSLLETINGDPPPPQIDLSHPDNPPTHKPFEPTKSEHFSGQPGVPTEVSNAH